MASKKTVGGFVREAGLGVPGETLAQRLDALAGVAIGSGGTAFLRNVDDIRNVIECWVPIHMLPIAYESGAPVGLHLRTADVESGRIGVLLGIGGTSLSQVAASLDAYVFRALAQLEAEVVEGDADEDELDAAVEAVGRAFGGAFYTRGQIDAVENLEDLMVERFGGSPHDYGLLSLPAATADEKLALLRKGLDTDRGSLHLHAQCARLLAERKDWSGAADAAIASLGCYHHTADVTDVEDHIAFCRRLAANVPGARAEQLRAALPPESPQGRLEQVGTLMDARRLPETEKALADLCYDLGDYMTMLEAFENLYRKLEWRWALALCGLRR